MAVEDPARFFQLDGRVAVVTGASSGLGVTFAETLAGAGAHVVLAARRAVRLEALADRLAGESGREMLAVACDVGEETQVEELARRALERFGRVDVLVNNAGVTSVQPAESESAAAFRRVVDVNLLGTFLCARRFGAAMLEAGRGAIVNVASVLGLVGAGQIPQAAYAATKGGVVNLTRELAAQWARRGVRVNAIAPGWFPSEMTEEMLTDERARRWLRSRTPMGRPGELDELAAPLLFLAGDGASFVTGQVMVVDGGWTIV